MSRETVLSWLAMAALVGVCLLIGVRRERQKRESLRGFALKHGLRFDPGSLTGSGPHLEGTLDGLAFFAGDKLVAKFTPGVGPAPRETYFHVRWELPASVPVDEAAPPRFGDGVEVKLLPEGDKAWLTAKRKAALERLARRPGYSVRGHAVSLTFSDWRALTEERLEGITAEMRTALAELK